MRIEQKPTELLEAQVAIYAESLYETPERQNELLSRLGDVALHTSQVPESTTYPSKHPKKGFEDGAIVTLEPAGTPLPLFDKQEYADTLKNPVSREQSYNLATMRKTYAHIAPQVDVMDIHDISYQTAGEHPDLLGRGSNKAAFAFQAEVDGVEKDLVALVDHAPDKSNARLKMLERAANLALVKGKPGFEQGVAWSNDPPVVVAERAPGRSLEELSQDQRSHIPDKHWQTLVDNVETVADLGIKLDPMLGNFYYDPAEGFTIIDFQRSTPGAEETTHRTNMKQIEELRASIS